jgi:hypothetical protein
MGAIERFSIGQITGGQIGAISNVLVQSGWFSPFMHTHEHSAHAIPDVNKHIKSTIDKQVFFSMTSSFC